MQKAKETYEDMLRRAFRAEPGTAAAIIERARAIYSKTSEQITADCRALFGCDWR